MSKEILPSRTIQNIWRILRRTHMLILGLKGWANRWSRSLPYSIPFLKTGLPRRNEPVTWSWSVQYFNALLHLHLKHTSLFDGKADLVPVTLKFFTSPPNKMVTSSERQIELVSGILLLLASFASCLARIWSHTFLRWTMELAAVVF